MRPTPRKSSVSKRRRPSSRLRRSRAWTFSQTGAKSRSEKCTVRAPRRTDWSDRLYPRAAATVKERGSVARSAQAERPPLVHEALPIAVITRFIGWFHEFGIPIGGVIVNMLMDRQALGADVPEFVLNRMRMQDDHMKTIGEKFDGRVRAIVPLFDEEVRGTTMLARAAVALFA